MIEYVLYAVLGGMVGYGFIIVPKGRDFHKC